MSSVKLVAIGGLLFFSLAIWVGYRYFDSSRQASHASRLSSETSRNLQEGMTPEEVDPFVQDAVMHYQCRNTRNGIDRVEDYYLFHDDVDISFPLMLIYKEEQEQLILEKIFYVEPYLLSSYVEGCAIIPPG